MRPLPQRGPSSLPQRGPPEASSLRATGKEEGVLEPGYGQGGRGGESRRKMGGAEDELGNRATEGVGAGVKGRADTCPFQTEMVP